MTGRRLVGGAVAALSVGLASGCTSGERSDAGTTTSTTSTTTAVVATTAGPRSDQHTVVRSDSGDVEVRGDGAVLDVIAVRPHEGWQADVVRPDKRSLMVAFVGTDGRTEVTIVLTESGISSSTRSVRGN